MMDTAESALGVISILVVFGGLLGMLTMLLANLNQRRREMAILRAIGARPQHVGVMFLAEAILITLAGCIVGLVFLYVCLAILQPIIEVRLGLFIPITFLSFGEWSILGVVLSAATFTGLVPAFLAYRQSLSDGMTLRM